jgi:hypothetical protein
MTGSSLVWIDWKLSPWAMVRETAWRFFLLFPAGLFLVVLLLSGGMNRFLSEQWTVTAILRLQVPPAEGEGIAKKAAVLAGARTALYRDPEASWKEFLSAYPGLSALRAAGGNPLPGYVEVRMHPGRFTEADIGAVEAALRPLPQVERVLSGGEALPRLMRVRDGVNAILWAGFALLCTAVLSIFLLMEKSRTSSLAADFDFLRERGVPVRSIVVSRASGALLTGIFLSLAAMGTSALLFFLLEDRLPLLGRVIGPAEELLTPPLLVPAALFVIAVALFSGAASPLGWHAAQSRPK